MSYTPDIDLKSFEARRNMSSLLDRPSGKNLLGSLQEAPLDDPYLRQEIFDDRLSQSGTTYGEHSSASLSPRGGTTGIEKIPLDKRSTPDWAQLRKDEIARAISNQEKDISRMPEGTSKEKTEKELAVSKLEALKADQKRILDTLDKRDLAKQSFMEKGGTWSSAKKDAGKDPASMKEARWQRQEFMETTLTGTAQNFLSEAAKKMGIDPPVISELKRTPPKEGDPDYDKKLREYQGYESQYLDGRTRRFQLEIGPPASETYGKTLTVNFLAPGSTEDTSDIDMQFIVEENPSMCSELIKTFQSTANDNLGQSELKGKSLAERFDTNPYPAGFVFRPELGSDLHFSDTYTKDSLDQKKMMDGGLALLRRLDSSKDPKADIEKMVAGLKEPEKSNMLRTISVGVEVSLKAQVDRANALQSKLPKEGELSVAGSKLEQTTKQIGQQGGPSLWKRDEVPTIEELASKLGQSQELASQMSVISGLPGGQQLVAEARNDVYINALKDVERLTSERDQTVSKLGQGVLKLDEAVKKLDAEIDLIDEKLKLNPNDKMLLGQRGEVLQERETALELQKKAMQEMRDQTSELGVESFTAQGVALHHADEAYTNRGAIGHVVEQQMGRKFVATSSSAISSIEANHGFALEHFEHDLEHKIQHHNENLKEGEKPMTLEDIKGEDLSKFAASVGKYAERIGQTMETVDYRSVIGVKEGDKRVEAPHQKLSQLGKDLASIKKGINPSDGKAITDPSIKTELVTAALKKAGIENAQQFKDMLNNAVSDSWTAHLKTSTEGPKQQTKITAEMLQEQHEKLKKVTTYDRSSVDRPKVGDLIGKFGGEQQGKAALKNEKGESTIKKLRDHPSMKKFIEAREQKPEGLTTTKKSVK